MTALLLEMPVVAVRPPAVPAGIPVLLSARTAVMRPDPVPLLAVRGVAPAGRVQAVLVVDLSAQ
jgi:hypothetical protein